jgi:tetratricopeptide (TPR) repeat protein
VRTERSAFVLIAACAGLACTTRLEQGEKAYQRGDRERAIETWRGIDSAEIDYRSAQDRIEAVADERVQLVARYTQRARYFEERGRLAEAALDYRLALRLDPGDAALLGHVQELARRLAIAREEGLVQFRAAFARDDLAAARVHIASLRTLDAFSPEIADEQRRLAAALAGRIDASLARGRDGFAARRYASAERAFRAVLELDPQNESARGYLAYIERERAAAPDAEIAAAADPDPADLAPAARPQRPRSSEAEIRAEGFLQNALAAEAAGDAVQAIRYDLAALDADARHAGARSHLVSLRRALAAQVPMLIEAGRRHFQREDLRAALDQWERALLIEPGNAEAREHAQRAQNLLDRLEELRAAPLPPVSSPR